MTFSRQIAGLFVLGGLLIPQTAPAQFEKAWDVSMGGSEIDWLTVLRTVPGGGYIVGGYSERFDGTDDNFRVARISPAGSVIWHKTYGSDDHHDQLFDIAAQSDGSFMLAGHSISDAGEDKSEDNIGQFDLWLLKVDAGGTRIMDKTIGADQFDYLSAMRPTADGGFLLAGYSNSDVSGDRTAPSRGLWDYWIVRVDANGSNLWDRAYGGANGDILRAMEILPDGGFIFGGHSQSDVGGDKGQPSRGGNDYWVVRTDANGNLLWEQTYGGGSSDELHAIALTPDGGFILGGDSYSDTGGEKSENARGLTDCWLIRIDANGNVLWDRTYGGTSYEFCRDIKPIPGGGYFVGASTLSPAGFELSQAPIGDYDMWLLHIGEDGAPLRDQRIGGYDNDYFEDMLIVTQAVNTVLLSGRSNSTDGGDINRGSFGRDDFWSILMEGKFSIQGEVTGCLEDAIPARLVLYNDEMQPIA
ncbi:MAG: hypothetical protein AAF492_17640, partial [Verrucomicrobiota bacterium]